MEPHRSRITLFLERGYELSNVRDITPELFYFVHTHPPSSLLYLLSVLVCVQSFSLTSWDLMGCPGLFDIYIIFILPFSYSNVN